MPQELGSDWRSFLEQVEGAVRDELDGAVPSAKYLPWRRPNHIRFSLGRPYRLYFAVQNPRFSDERGLQLAMEVTADEALAAERAWADFHSREAAIRRWLPDARLKPPNEPWEPGKSPVMKAVLRLARPMPTGQHGIGDATGWAAGAARLAHRALEWDAPRPVNLVEPTSRAASVFITNWNPIELGIDDEQVDEAVRDTANGGVWTSNWSLGSRRGGVAPGDTAVMLRQHSDRGLVASGTFTSEVYLDTHWNDDAKLASYGDIDWDTWLPIEDRLPVEVLLAEVPGVHWNQLQGSGVQVHEPDATAVIALWQEHLASVDRARSQTGEEVEGTYAEGSTRQVVVNRYERDPRARDACIAKWGSTCSVCGFDFGKTYGDIGKGFIVVHHLMDLSLVGDNYQVDPVKDLRPVCPNCHAMLHGERPALNIEELREQIAWRRQRPARARTDE